MGADIFKWNIVGKVFLPTYQNPDGFIFKFFPQLSLWIFLIMIIIVNWMLKVVFFLFAIS